MTPRRLLPVPVLALLLAALAVVAWSSSSAVLSVSAASPPAEYMGCYADRADAVHRALPLLQELSPAMRVPACLGQCAALGFEWAGLEYHSECYCGNQEPPYEKLKEEQCDSACAGDAAGESVSSGSKDPKRRCGGALSLSVWRQRDLPAPSFDADRPLVCLVMMLKDEAHTVASTLSSVADAVDCWLVLDTGSTDGTPELIEQWFAAHVSPISHAALPGRIVYEPFVDYGATRNRVLDLARDAYNPIFTLMLSADERVENPEVLRSFLQEVRYARGTQHGAYPVVMNTGLTFDSLRLARVDSAWRYKARVHEYLSPPTGPYVGLYRSPTHIRVRFNVTDGPRRFASQFFIKRILEEDLAKNPNDTRSIYYLARTNAGIGNHSEAFKYYDMLSKVSTWDEERYHGMVQRALMTKHLPNFDWRERQSMLLDAFAYKPDNMDALHALAQDHFDSGRFQLAYLFALRAVELPLPAGLAGIENVLLRPTKWLYDYEGQRLLGFAARQLGEWAVCVRAFEAVLRVQTNDTIVQDRIKLCRDELAKLGTFQQPAVHPVPTNAAPLSRVENSEATEEVQQAVAAAVDAAAAGAQVTAGAPLSIPGSWHPGQAIARGKHRRGRRQPARTSADGAALPSADVAGESDEFDAAAADKEQALFAAAAAVRLSNPAVAELLAEHHRKQHGGPASIAHITEEGHVHIDIAARSVYVLLGLLGLGVAALLVLRKLREPTVKKE